MEAIFNLGLVNIHLGLPGDSLQAFEKLHTIIPNNTEVIYHIANLYEVLYDPVRFRTRFSVLDCSFRVCW